MADQIIPRSTDKFSMFQPEVFTSQQLLRDRFQGSMAVPDKRLRLAVLQDAIECFCKYLFANDPHGKYLFQDAETWIFNPNLDWPFSFDHICQALDIDPGYLRMGLRKWRKEQERRVYGRETINPRSIGAAQAAALLK